MLPHTIPKADPTVNPMPVAVDLHACPTIRVNRQRLDEDGRWLDGLQVLLEGFAYEVEIQGLNADQVAYACDALGSVLRWPPHCYDLTNERSRGRLIDNAINYAMDPAIDEEMR